MIKKYIKYYLLRFLYLSPVIIGLILVIIVALREPYVGSLYCYGSEIRCIKCNTVLGSNELYCNECGGFVADVAAVMNYSHCNYCDSNKVYRNEQSTFCKYCGGMLSEERSCILGQIGFTTIKEFREAKFLESLNYVLNNKIIICLVICCFCAIARKWIYQTLKRKALKQIVDESINKQIY